MARQKYKEKALTLLSNQKFKKVINFGFLLSVLAIVGVKSWPTYQIMLEINHVSTMSEKLKSDLDLLAVEKKNIQQKLQKSQAVTDHKIKKTEINEAVFSDLMRQLDEFGKVVDVDIKLTGRSESNYEKAIKLELLISANNLKQQGKALDFLQLYGYLESFDGNKAILHFRES